MFRIPKQPTPEFKLPPPYQPISGEHLPLRGFGDFPYCAMMQVAADDYYRDYVVCRGYDTRIKRYIDYPPGIPVAKPYGKRIAYVYDIGQIFPVFLPLWDIGQNPGVVDEGGADSGGQPANLAAEFEHVKDDQGNFINWMLVDVSGSGGAIIGYTTSDITAYDDATETPGEGTMDIWRRNRVTGIMENTNISVEVFNPCGQVADETRVVAQVIDSEWWLDTVCCP